MIGTIGATEDSGGINGIAAAIGGKTPAIVDDVNAAIALAAFAARLLENMERIIELIQFIAMLTVSLVTYSSSTIFFLMSANSCGISHLDSFVVA